MGAVRYPVMPSLVALQQMRNRLHLAQLGKKLMKWTAMATLKELRRIANEIQVLIKDYEVKCRTAFIMLARARYFVPQLNYSVLESIPAHATVTVKRNVKSVSGVKTQYFSLVEGEGDGYLYLGMSKGGIQIQQCKEAWLELIKQMILICQYRVTFVMVDAANKNATKKQNVLSRCILPRIAITMTYVLSELDEMEREETFRLKRFKQLRYKKLAEDKKAADAKNPAVCCAVPVPEEPVRKRPPRVPAPPPPPPAPRPPPPPPPKLPPPPKPAPAPPPPIPVPVLPPEPEPVPELPACCIMPPTVPICCMPYVPEAEPEPIPEPEPEPPEPPVPPLELLMTHLNEVLALTEQLEAEERAPDQEFGLTKCDLAGLKLQLTEILKLNEVPIRDRVCETCSGLGRLISTCSCPKADEAKHKEIVPGYQIDEKVFKSKTPIPEYILKPQRKAGEPAPTRSAIDEFESYVDEVIKMTFNYQGEGLLCNPEEFIKSCHSVKNKLQEAKNNKKLKAKLDRLKERVEKLETMTDIVQKEALSSTSISSFLSCCKEFKDRLDHNNICKGAPAASSIERLVTQIDNSILLSQEAKIEGLVTSESVDDFINNCNEIKTKILTVEEKPKVVDKLLDNIDDIINFISKYKKDGSVSESIENFYKTCMNTKKKLDTDKMPKKNIKLASGACGQGLPCSGTLSFDKPKAVRSPCGLPCHKSTSKPHVKPCWDSTPKSLSFEKSCGGASSPKKPCGGTTTPPKSSAPCGTCGGGATTPPKPCGGTTTPPKPSGVCGGTTTPPKPSAPCPACGGTATPPKPRAEAPTKPSKPCGVCGGTTTPPKPCGTPTKPSAPCGVCGGTGEPKLSGRSTPTKPCGGSTTPTKPCGGRSTPPKPCGVCGGSATPPKPRGRSASPKRSQSGRSTPPSKSCCRSPSPKPCGRSTPPKPTGRSTPPKVITCALSPKSSQSSVCNVCKSSSSAAPSSTKNMPCTKTICSHKSASSQMSTQSPSISPSASLSMACSKATCTECRNATPERSRSVESVCNSCAKLSKNLVSQLKGNKNQVQLKKNQKGYYEHTVETIIKKLQDVDGSVIENSETVTVRQRIVDAKQRPVDSQKSVKCTKQINVCEDSAPTAGFIRTAKSFKSACDISRPCIPPMIWSSMSLDTGQQRYSDPLFCVSPMESDSYEID